MIRAIAACTSARAIGRDNAIPWHHPADLKHFSRLTTDDIVIMGRRTWDSLPPKYRPLPRRMNVVMTRDPEWEAEGAVVCRTMHDVSEVVGTADAWVMGGQQIYELFWPMTEEIHLTVVPDLVPDADTYFPYIDRKIWHCAQERRDKDLIFRVFRRSSGLTQ